MQQAPIRSLSVGQTLDRSFHLYRTLFTPLFLLTLLMFGPFYLLSSLLLVDVGALQILPNFQGFTDLEAYWSSRFPENALAGGAELWIRIAGIAIMAAILLFAALPLHTATCIILVNKKINGGPAELASAFKEALTKYGRVLAGGILFWLICSVLYIAVMLLNGMLSILYGGVILSTAALSSSAAAQTVSGIIFLIFYLAVTFSGIIVYYYFVIRFGFFLPAVLSEKEGVGIRRSWLVTRRSFWRLMGIGLNFSILMYAFWIALAMVLSVLGVTLTGLLTVLFVCCAVVPAGLVVYTVAYRVQKVRCDGEDLAMMIAALRGES